jgi:cytochrome P450
MEATLVLAMIVQRYRVRPVNERPVEPEVRTTLRPRGGLPVIVKRA